MDAPPPFGSGQGGWPADFVSLLRQVAYFGGSSDVRTDANIAELAKMRIVMIEKWEGKCWSECLVNSSAGRPCSPGCNVERDMLMTLHRVKQANPSVATVFYLNSLLAFPFYKLTGDFESSDALLRDANTGAAVELRNDNGMKGVYAWDFGSGIGRQLYLDFVYNITKAGVVDGIFADKWTTSAIPNTTSADQRWRVCNKGCGGLLREQALAYNAGKAQVLRAVRELLSPVGGMVLPNPNAPFSGIGAAGPPVYGNVYDDWFGGWKAKWDPAPLLADIKQAIANGSYVYLGCGDAEGSRLDGATNMLRRASRPEILGRPPCFGGKVLALFLLVVEPGVFLGANGWDPNFDRPLGAPHGPAVLGPDGNYTRGFAAGVAVRWNPLRGTGAISWGGGGSVTV